MALSAVPDPQKARVEALLMRLVVEPRCGTPVPRPGFAATFLYPCDDYRLPPERHAALREYALASGATGFVVRSLTQTLVHRRGQPSPAEAVDWRELELIRDDPAAYRAHMEETHETLPARAWRGEWGKAGYEYETNDVLGYEGESEALMEHALLDESGRWVVLFDPDDFAWLVSDPATSSELLARWHTTPVAEIERCRAEEHPDPTWMTKVLRHAQAQAWA
jgi:hypothetical protein